MAYHFANIGRPVTDAWWRRNVEYGFISIGHEGKPDLAKRRLLSFGGGDWIFAFAKDRGYVGAGLAGSPQTYRFASEAELPSDFQSTQRHLRAVTWIYIIPAVLDAVKWPDAGYKPPPQTIVQIYDETVGEQLLRSIAERAMLVAPEWQEHQSLAATFLVSNLESEEDEIGLGEEDLRNMRIHKRLERNRMLAARVKERLGFTCQVCRLNFEERYGVLGKGFIEAHHLVPIAQLKGQVVVLSAEKDFRVLCSNCHRMIHKSRYIGDIDQFYKIHVQPNEP